MFGGFSGGGAGGMDPQQFQMLMQRMRQQQGGGAMQEIGGPQGAPAPGQPGIQGGVGQQPPPAGPWDNPAFRPGGPQGPPQGMPQPQPGMPPGYQVRPGGMPGQFGGTSPGGGPGGPVPDRYQMQQAGGAPGGFGDTSVQGTPRFQMPGAGARAAATGQQIGGMGYDEMAWRGNMFVADPKTQDPRTEMMNLPPRLRAAVLGGRMSLGGAMGRNAQFQGGQLPGQQSQGPITGIGPGGISRGAPEPAPAPPMPDQLLRRPLSPGGISRGAPEPAPAPPMPDRYQVQPGGNPGQFGDTSPRRATAPPQRPPQELRVATGAPRQQQPPVGGAPGGGVRNITAPKRQSQVPPKKNLGRAYQ
jgi:polyadenylation factor subunit 2